YLLGENRMLDILFKLIFCGFVVVGATMNLESVLEFSDSMIFAMSLANLAGLYILAPVIRTALRDYEARGLSKR
ncbi:MAG: alanine:cation symporter family protein, partial [Oceanibaculum nanhaiense]|nr:alanine:cation symporter family protein [Oceanibaculum nanhaiense]